MLNFIKKSRESINLALAYFASSQNETMSYARSWPEAIQADPAFSVYPINLAENSPENQKKWVKKVKRSKFDVIVLMHQVFSNRPVIDWNSPLYDAISASSSSVVFFVGNEYKLMPEKMKFAEELGVNLLISQSNDSRVFDLYKERLHCDVDFLPNCGIDANYFNNHKPFTERSINIGYRSYSGPEYLGNRDKELIGEGFQKFADESSLIMDISMDPADRFDIVGWANFLNNCKFQLGVEAGYDYFEITDNTRKKVIQYLEANPSSTYEEIFDLFFKNYPNPVPMRNISGRHIEAMACGSVQILFEGHYNGYLEPDRHFIMLKKDFSNIGDVLSRLNDETYVSTIQKESLDLVSSEFQYATLVGHLKKMISRSCLN